MLILKTGNWGFVKSGASKRAFKKRPIPAHSFILICRPQQKTNIVIGGRFNERWGALVESLVEGSLVKILQDRGIDIMQTHTRSEALWRKPDGHIQKREFDIIVANGTEVVVVEVKTTLHSKDVKRFLETLQDFKKYFPRYKLETIYGAVAYLTSENKSHLLAEEEGLFVIRATGDSASIINTADFKPKSFGQTGER